MRNTVFPRLTALAVALLCSIFSIAQTAIQPQGEGTEVSPYLIRNWQELYWISQNSDSWDKYFLQTADIDFADAEPVIETWDNGQGWTPIGTYSISFEGYYNGDGYVIRHLYSNRPYSDCVAFFGCTNSSEISNVGLQNIYICGAYNAGGLVAYNRGSVKYCFTTGIVVGSYDAGGLVGENSGYRSTIENSYSMADVIGKTSMGAFMGSDYGTGKVLQCYSTGTVTSKDLITITNRGFVGRESMNNTYADNFWDTESSGQTTTGGDIGEYALGLTTEEMKNSSNFTNWDFETIWDIDPAINNGYPFLRNSAENYNQLNTAQLKLNIAEVAITSAGCNVKITYPTQYPLTSSGIIISTNPDFNDENAIVENRELNSVVSSEILNITFEGLTRNTTYYIKAYAENEFGISYSRLQQIGTLPFLAVQPQGEGTEVAPYLISNLEELYWIADQVNNYNNNFEGKYFLQTNDIDARETKNWFGGKGWQPIGCVAPNEQLYYNCYCTSVEFQGTYDGNKKHISNITINDGLPIQEGHEFKPSGFFRAIGADAVVFDLTLTDARVESTVCVGTFAGVNNGIISNCHVKGNSFISGNSLIGGFVGENNGEISKCSNIGIVSGIPSTYGDDWGHGGFAGVNNGLIEQVKSISTVVGPFQTGGFAEKNTGTIKNCYTIGNTKTTEDAYQVYANGFTKGGEVINCYSVGEIDCETTAFCSDNGLYVGNFLDSKSSNITSYINEVTSLSSAEMKSAFIFLNAGWDFVNEPDNGAEDIWAINPRYNYGYPYLAWEEPAQVFIGGTVYYDRNKDGQNNASDVPIDAIQIELQPEGIRTGTARGGSYLFYAEPGEHTVEVMPHDPYSQGTDNLQNTFTVELMQDTTLLDVGLYGEDIMDFELSMATFWSRCNGTVPVWVSVRSNSNVPANLELRMNLDPRVALQESSIPIDQTDAEGVHYYTLTDMQPYEHRELILTVLLPNATTDSVAYTAQLFHDGVEIKSQTVKRVVRCSYDPNDIQVSPEGETEAGNVPMGQELTYTIRFQNTGNDTAFLVDILDTLSPALDPETFQFVSSSHEVRYFIDGNGAIRFLFEDINLLGSTSNEAESHGYVMYKVSPKADIADGTLAEAKAYIYFDYNPAIETNTTTTTFIKAVENNDPVATQPQGEGTEASPYLISNLEELYWIADQVNNHDNSFEGKYFLQVNDIDASETKDWFDGEGWTPIGCSESTFKEDYYTNFECQKVSFEGIYKGNNKRINSIYIDINVSLTPVGLWGGIGENGVVENLELDNYFIRGTQIVGSIGGINNGRIENCTLNGTLSSAGLLGGIAAENNGEIIHCTANWNYSNNLEYGIIERCAAGGIVGVNTGNISKSSCGIVFEGKIIHYEFGGALAYNIGLVSQCACKSNNETNEILSGFVVSNWYEGRILNCYSHIWSNRNRFFDCNWGNIIENCYSIGSAWVFADCNGGDTISNNFWELQSGDSEIFDFATGLTTSEMKNATNYLDAGWDFVGETANGTENIWAIDPDYNDGYPYLTWERPTVIIPEDTLKEQIVKIAEGWNLISLSVHNSDSSLAGIFGNALPYVEQVKSEDNYFRALQEDYFNTLEYLQAGEAYFVKASQYFELQLKGKSVTLPFSIALKSGWNLVGYPLPDSSAISTLLNNAQIPTVKSFDGFWQFDSDLNSIDTFENGKGYYFNSESEGVWIWEE